MIVTAWCPIFRDRVEARLEGVAEEAGTGRVIFQYRCLPGDHFSSVPPPAAEPVH